MDNQLKPVGRVKPIFAYLKDSIKFHDTQNPLVAQVVFIVQLAILFGGYAFTRPYMQNLFVTAEQVSTKLISQFEAKNFDASLLNSDIYLSMLDSLFTILLVFFVIKSLTFLISLYYGTYYYFSLTNSSTTGSERASIFFKRLPKIILFNILFYIVFYIGMIALLMTTGVLTMFVPVLSILTLILPLAIMALNTLFIFKDLLMIQYDVGIFKNFKLSLNLTKGCKRNVILNGLWPLCMGWILSAFAVDIQNPMLSLFVAAFLEVVILLVSQRLIALMFIDAASLERQDKKTAKSI